MPKRCPRCNGQLYSDDPWNPKSDVWCLLCGEWIPPNGYRPLPYVSRLEEDAPSDAWYVDEYGDILDIIDQRIEEYMQHGRAVTVSAVAKAVHCSNYESRQTLERLTLRGKLRRFAYGPQDRWIGYQLVGERLSSSRSLAL